MRKVPGTLTALRVLAPVLSIATSLAAACTMPPNEGMAKENKNHTFETGWMFI